MLSGTEARSALCPAARRSTSTQVEKSHEERYRKLLANLKEDIVFKCDEEVVWVCRNCGYIHVGKAAPAVCPACRHPQAYFERKANNY